MKEDSHRYLKGLFNRANELNNVLLGIPEQRYYERGCRYFLLLEKRNEYLNQCISLLRKEYGIILKELRIHQNNAHEALMTILDVLEKEEKEKKEMRGQG